MDSPTSLAHHMLSDAVNIFQCCILTWDFLPVVLPAYLLAGAIAAFVPVVKVLRYLGHSARQWVAYTTAVIAGMVLSLCSCNIVPLVISVYKRGAGIGPAFALLYAGPAMELVTIVWTFQVFGFVFGIWRLGGMTFIAVVLGLAMTLLFHRDEAKRHAQLAEPLGPDPEPVLSELERQRPYRSWVVVGALTMLLILGAKGLPWALRLPALATFAVALLWALARWFEPIEVKAWLRESVGLLKMTLPLLIPAILLIAVAARKVPLEWFTLRADGVKPFFFLGDNSLRSTTIASLFGSVMYFPMLTEVPFVKAFLKQGMGVAPALAILMGGPGASLPGALIILRFLGWRKMLVYETLEIVLNTAVAYTFGRLYGDYRCPCLTGAERHASMEWVAGASGILAVALAAALFIAWRRRPAAPTGVPS